MPSPFPGMDPYLESEIHWSGLHYSLIGAMSNALNAALPEAYVARPQQRCWVESTDKYTFSDVSVHIASESPAIYGAARKKRGGAKTITQSDAPIRISATEESSREPFLQILRAADHSKVVAEIELLSHSNKRLGSDGRQLYLEKQRNLLHSHTHLVEIDLLRAGEHTAACPKAVLRKYGSWDYLVCIHPALTENEYFVWLKAVRDRLPKIQIPLEDPGAEVELDLQAVFDECYDLGAYSRELKYNAPPEPPLSPEDADWAAELLKKARK